MEVTIHLKLKRTGASQFGLSAALAVVGVWMLLTLSATDPISVWVISGAICLFSLAMLLLGVKYLRATPSPIKLTTGHIHVPLDLMTGTALQLAGRDIVSWEIKGHHHPLVRVLEIRSLKGVSRIPLDTIQRGELAHVLRHLETISSRFTKGFGNQNAA